MWPFKSKIDKRENETPNIIQQIDPYLENKIKEKQTHFLERLRNNKFDPMQMSSVFSAVNLISNAIAQMPWLIKSLDDRAVPGGLYLNHLFDNVLQTRFVFIKNLIKDVMIYGNGFAYIQRDRTGTPANMYYLPFGDCTIYYNPLSFNLLYQAPKVKNGMIEPCDILHFVMNSKDGIQGTGLLHFMAKTLELMGYTDKAALDYFANGMSVQGIIKSNNPNRLTDKQRSDIRKGWNAVEGNIRVLEGGLDYQQVQSNSREAELTSNRLFNIQDVARFFNINPVLLGDLSKMAYNTIEQANLEFVSHTLAPYIYMMEQEINRKLIMPDDKVKFCIDIDEESIIKSDKQSHANYLSTLVNNGIMTRNEARYRLDLPDVEGGDELVIPYTDIEQNTVTETDSEIFKENTSEKENEEG
jgi:HK97 family phage portal protein